MNNSDSLSYARSTHFSESESLILNYKKKYIVQFGGYSVFLLIFIYFFTGTMMMVTSEVDFTRLLSKLRH